MQSTFASDLKSTVLDEIEKVSAANADFQEALDTYVQQYGPDKIRISEATDLSGSIDPVIVVLGRNCIVTYNDSTKQLNGELGSVTLSQKDIFLIGRRQPQDSKLVAWNVAGAVDLQEYNSRVDTIPSRVHGVLANLEDGRTVYADLGSSAGTVLVGQSRNLGGAFVRIYDSGSEVSNSIKLQRIFTSNTQQIHE